MIRKSIRMLGAVLLVCLAPGFAMAQPAEVSEFYQVQHLRHDVMQILARKACEGSGKTRGDGFLGALHNPSTRKPCPTCAEPSDG